LAPDVIIAKIRSSTCRFDLATDALVQLKSARVDDRVLQAMLEATAGDKRPAAAGNGATTARVYLLREGASDADRIPLARAPVNQNFKVGMFSWGNHVVIPGRDASVRSADPRPVFLFEFDDGRTALKDWTLTRLERTDEGGGREIDPENAQPLLTEARSPGILRVTPKKSLKRGEYAFYKGVINSSFVASMGTPGAQSDLIVFDFGLDKAPQEK
jgi:hypothetical protein